MYALKPVFSVPADLRISCSMYKLKNLHETVAAFDESDRDLNDIDQLNDQEIEVLLKKQNEVLNVLEQLELRLQKLSFKSNDVVRNTPELEKQSVTSILCNTVGEKSEKKLKINVDTTNLINEDIVVFADPEVPPYSLLALPVLWPTVSWDISYHVHSTITTNLKSLETIKVFKNVSSKVEKRTVKVFVIWQHITPSPKCMRSPTYVLTGEVPLLWLFNTIVNAETVSADLINQDKVMTLINVISFSKNDRSSELYNFITDDSTTILDIKNVAMWSLLKRNKNPPKIEKWIQQFSKMIVK